MQELSVHTSWAIAFVLISSGLAKIIFPSKGKFFDNRLIEFFKSNLKFVEVLIGITIFNFRTIGLLLSLSLFIVYLLISAVLFLNKYKKPCNCFGTIVKKPINFVSLVALGWLIGLNLIAFTNPRGEPGIIGIILYFGTIVLMVL